jgi:hypothetical protein
MKYPHILEQVSPEKKLRFTIEIDPEDGSHHKHSCHSDPSNWKNVRHISGNLYYVWDEDPMLGCVFIGEYA